MKKLHLLKTLHLQHAAMFFLSANQILAPPQHTRKKTQAAWFMNVCGLFQAGCENITQELHFVMSNLIFE